MTTVSKNTLDVSYEIVDKYSNKYHRTIKMKPIDDRSGSYAEYSVDSNTKDAKFKIGDHIKISKDKNIFAKDYARNWSIEVFVIRKVKNSIDIRY